MEAEERVLNGWMDRGREEEGEVWGEGGETEGGLLEQMNQKNQ